jgi:hypothetical protein
VINSLFLGLLEETLAQLDRLGSGEAVIGSDGKRVTLASPTVKRLAKRLASHLRTVRWSRGPLSDLLFLLLHIDSSIPIRVVALAEVYS